MRKIVAALAAFVACSATAAEASDIDLVHRNGDTTVRLTGAPCELSFPMFALAQTIPGAAPKKAHVIYHGRDIQACWAKDEENDVLVVLDGGQGGWIPLEQFKSDSGV